MATQGLMTSQLADMLQAGMSPEEIRMQMADAKAMEWAKMPTSQKMSYNIGRSVGGFTDSLLNAFGVQQQDPALAKATQLAQIRNEIDPTNEKSIIAGAQKLAQLGFGREAQELATKALATREKESIIAKNLREKAAADPFQKLLEKGVYKPTSLKKFKDSGNPDDLEFKDSEAKTTVIKADGRTKLINSQTGEVIADLGAASEGIKIINEIPGLKGTGDIVSLRQNLNTTLKPFRDAVNASDAAIALADDVLKTGNFASASALSRQLAKAVGEQQLSKADVDAFGGDPSLVGMVSDVASRLATGTPTADTTRKLKQLATIIKKKNEALENNEIKQTQRTAELSGLYKPEQIKEVFTLRGAKQAGGNKRTTKSGVTYYVSEEE